MAETNYTPGQFVWHEIVAPDVEASKKFYGDLFGWTFDDVDMGTMVYTMIKMGEKNIGGLMPLSAIGRDGVPPHLMGYVSVPNVDEAAAAAKSNGGSTMMDPMDIPNVGRMVVIADPKHGYTTAFKAAEGDPPSEMPGVGTFCWNQLTSQDAETAKTFYQKVYGWTNKDFGEGGGNWVFQVGESPAAGLLTAPEGVPTHWLTYVAVADVDASRAKAVELGATVMLEKMPIPGMGHISVVTDSSGITFGLFQSTMGG